MQLKDFHTKIIYLVGAGLADPDGVWVVPFDLIAEPTDNLAGLAGVEVITLRVGILVGVPSSVIEYDDCGGKKKGKN